jgi:prevent-host-death family protein
MAKKVNIYEAKTHLSALIDEVVGGEEVVVARAGKPLVRLVAIAAIKPSAAFGMDRGKVKMAPDFEATPHDFDEYSC